jgi:hypothetical protein
MNEDRILDKLDSLDAKTTHVLVGLARVEEQVRDVPDLKSRVQALEKWRWTAMGALLAAGGSLGTQLLKVVG